MKKSTKSIFESFDEPGAFEKDANGNYKNPTIHNIWIGFKNWYEKKNQPNAGDASSPREEKG